MSDPTARGVRATPPGTEDGARRAVRAGRGRRTAADSDLVGAKLEGPGRHLARGQPGQVVAERVAVVLQQARVLLQAQPAQVLPHRHGRVDLGAGALQQAEGALGGALGRALVLQQVALDLRHGELARREPAGEAAGLVLAAGEEAEEHAHHLLPRGVADHHLDVAAARPDEGGVEALDVVGGHHEDAPLLRGDAVDGVEQAREGDGARVARRPLQLAVGEDRVHVLEDHDRPARGVAHQRRQPVVRHALVGKGEHAHVEPQRAGEDLAEGGLAAARGAVEEVAAAVRDAEVGVPLARREELARILDEVLGQVVIQHDRVEGPRLLA